MARLFPSGAPLVRLVRPIEVEISEDRIASKRYLDMNMEIENKWCNKTFLT